VKYDQNSEFKRGQIRSKLGLATIIESDNSRRTPSRAREASKVGLTILLMLSISCLIAGTWISSWFFTPAVVLGMLYALALIITPNESANEN
jgi:fatty acid desaturase